MHGLFNQVATLFENEDILTSVSELFIWTSYDPTAYPYKPNATLSNFRTEKRKQVLMVI